MSGTQEMVGLDDLAALFQLSVREERDALTVSYKGRTVVLTPDQTIASVSGRVISLPAPPMKAGARWLVPIDFIARALVPIYDVRLDVRRPSHLLIVGDLRVPRVTVRLDPAGTGTRVTVDTAPRAAATVSQEGAQRLALRFDADAIDLAPLAPPAGLVQAIRVVDTTSLAIDLAPAFRSLRTSTQALDASGRLTIDLLASQNDAAPPPATTQGEPPPTELPAPPAQSSLLRTLAIDPGHGGDDVGAKGPGGALEKDVTLAIARRLKSAVESRLGLRVLMTRDIDSAVAVADRAAMANNSRADLFISLHTNASFRSSVSGATVYVARFEDTAFSASKTAPERLPVFGGGTRDIELVPWSLAQIRHKAQSQSLANVLAEQLAQRVPVSARPVDAAPLRVLESANMAAVLVEVGYLTNPDQERQLTSGDFQGVVAQGIVDAIVRFRETQGSPEGGAR